MLWECILACDTTSLVKVGGIINEAQHSQIAIIL